MKAVSSNSRINFLGLALICLAAFASHPSAYAQQDVPASKIDEVFSEWNKPDSPGCAVAVIKDGKIVYKKGYGIADFEHDIPIAPESAFYVGSVSKQFTAFAIALLEQEKKLSLDDDIRKYVPELPNYGTPITVRHLVHHTSGLRDYGTLLGLAGRRGDEAFDNNTVLEISSRQRELNFKPGDQYLYSNTGYAMLALIVERVSGMRFSAFTEQRIFKPLGMSNTHFHDDLSRMIKHRAYAYAPRRGGGFQLDTPYNERVGAGGVFTTVEDLFKWDQNFYHPRVGGDDLIKRIETTGVLNNGRKIHYAFGLGVGTYKGLRVVEHGGALAGYRAQLTRFPSEKLSVVCLCNLGTINPGRLASRVAELFLGPGPNAEEVRSGTLPQIVLTQEELSSKAGTYMSSDGDVVTVATRNGRLVADPVGAAIEFVPVSATRFKSINAPVDIEIQFANPSATQRNLTVKVDTQPPQSFTSVQAVSPASAQLAEYSGAYYSEELQITYKLAAAGDKLQLTYRNAPPSALSPTAADSFRAGGRTFRFTRDERKRVSGFRLNAGRVRNLLFVKR